MTLLKQLPDRNELYLYEGIGIFGITAKAVAEALAPVDASKPLDVYINSPGGNVWDGLAIYNMLERYDGDITTYADGMAASVGSLIYMVGKERYINSGAALMIHAPMVVAMGNANELKDALSFLEGAQKRCIQLYADATGLEGAYFEEIMASGKDKWYSEDEAITASLATKKKNKPAVKAVLDTSLYNMSTLPDWLQVEDTTPESIRKAEKALTSSGLSRREAKAVLAGGWQAKDAPQDSERDAHANRLLKALTS